MPNDVVDTSREVALCRVIWDACKVAQIELAGMSWGGRNVHGTRASIDYVQKAVHYYEQMDATREAYLARIKAAEAERDTAVAEAGRLREALKQADKAMAYAQWGTSHRARLEIRAALEGGVK